MNCHHSGFTHTSFLKEIHRRHNQSNHALFCWEDTKLKLQSLKAWSTFNLSSKKQGKKLIINHIIYGSHSLLNPEKTKLKLDFCFALSSKFHVPIHTTFYSILYLETQVKPLKYISFLNILSHYSATATSIKQTAVVIPGLQILLSARNCQIVKVPQQQSFQQFSTQLSTSRFISPVLKPSNPLTNSVFCWKK